MTITKVITKKRIGYVIVLAWLIFSLVYIGYDGWKDFRDQKLKQAYQNGYGSAVNDLIAEAEKCQPFVVFNTETKKEIQLMNIDCQQNTSAETSQ